LNYFFKEPTKETLPTRQQKQQNDKATKQPPNSKYGIDFRLQEV